jgi:hypothetical protein
MELLNEYISEYKKQMEKGVIQKAYRGLMEYIMNLRTHFSNQYPDLTPENWHHNRQWSHRWRDSHSYRL